uniref:Uncharacterized protein n=1 Tax=Triticum urartu TaxID=4572 RepID=A0A8R7TTU8_TRIUA
MHVLFTSGEHNGLAREFAEQMFHGLFCRRNSDSISNVT